MKAFLILLIALGLSWAVPITYGDKEGSVHNARPICTAGDRVANCATGNGARVDDRKVFSLGRKVDGGINGGGKIVIDDVGGGGGGDGVGSTGDVHYQIGVDKIKDYIKRKGSEPNN